MSSPEAKKIKVDGEEAGEDEGDQIMPALAEADAVQAQLAVLDEESSEKVLAIQMEYDKKRQPFYQQRAQVLTGIPFFWKDALTAHPKLMSYFTDGDLEVLEYLVDVQVTDGQDLKAGYTIVMSFGEMNPFFSNRELKKQLRWDAEGSFMTATGTDIQWYPGKGSWPEPDAPQVGAKRHMQPDYDFFGSWWASGPLPAGQEEGDEWGEAFREEVWPDPLRWYRERQQQLLNGHEDNVYAGYDAYGVGAPLEGEEEEEEEEEEDEGEEDLEQGEGEEDEEGGGYEAQYGEEGEEDEGGGGGVGYQVRYGEDVLEEGGEEEEGEEEEEEGEEGDPGVAPLYAAYDDQLQGAGWGAAEGGYGEQQSGDEDG